MKKRTIHVILWFALCAMTVFTFFNAISLSMDTCEKRDFVITKIETVFSGGFLGGDAHYATLLGDHGFNTPFTPTNKLPIDVGMKEGDTVTTWYNVEHNEIRPNHITHQVAGYGIGILCLGMTVFLFPWWKRKAKASQ